MPTWISSNELNSLPARLRALRDFDPPPGGWERLQARTRARRRYAYAGGGLALAASVLFGVAVSLGIGVQKPQPAAPAIETAQAAASNADISRLINTSQQLEQRLARVRPEVAVWDSSREARASELEHGVMAIDAELNYASDRATTETLWRNRVQLMNALVDLHKPRPREPALMYASYQY